MADRHRFNVERIDAIDEYIQTANSLDVQKGIVDHKHAYNSKKNWFWGLEYESLVVSKYKYDKAVTIVYKPVNNLPDGILESEEFFETSWGRFSINEINQYYFPLGNESYEVLPIPQAE